MSDGENRASPSLPPRKTRIVATLGPASSEAAVLERMIDAGLNVARINFAHGSRQSHRESVQALRAAATRAGLPVAVFGDLPGPKIRVGEIRDEPVELAEGAPFILQAEPITGDATRASVSFERLPEVVHAGDRIFVNDGFIELAVESVEGGEVHCRVVVGGELRSHKGVNFPNADLGIRAFTDQDLEFLRFAAELGLDGVSQSFVQDSDDVEAVRAAARDLGYDPFVIAKIERAKALDHLDDILAAADALMVARGDLGVETPIERMALEQKRIIAAANRAGVPVITATHMLESMTEHTRPTRAEATDVANAILDGSDALMLSGETAVGHHPIEVVRTVARIAEEIERAGIPTRGPAPSSGRRWSGTHSEAERLSTAAFAFIEGLEPEIVVTATRTGRAARLLTRFRIEPWIVALTTDDRTPMRLAFSFGVLPVRIDALTGDVDARCRSVLADLDVREGLALLLIPGDVVGDRRSQQIHILELGGAKDGRTDSV